MELLKRCWLTVWYGAQLLTAGLLIVFMGLVITVILGFCYLWKSTKWYQGS